MLELAHKDSVAFSAQAATLAAYRAPTLLQSFFECRDTMMRRLAVSLARRQEVGVLSLPACAGAQLSGCRNCVIEDRHATPRLQALLQEGFSGQPSAWSALQQTRVSLQRVAGRN